MKYDVFISYSSRDQKVVEGICAYLEQYKIKCFVAYRDIPRGKPWPPYIPEALNESRMMVVVFSGNFNRSEEVDRELTIATKKKKPILTFRLSDEEFKGTKEYYLSNINWIDAFPNPEITFGELKRNVEFLLQCTRQRNDKLETICFKNGDRYVGELKNGYFHGHGIYYWSDGGRHEGEYKDGKANGHGICYYANGDRYEGEWKDDNKHGHGIFYLSNGNRYEKEYEYGILIKSTAQQ